MLSRQWFARRTVRESVTVLCFDISVVPNAENSTWFLKTATFHRISSFVTCSTNKVSLPSETAVRRYALLFEAWQVYQKMLLSRWTRSLLYFEYRKIRTSYHRDASFRFHKSRSIHETATTVQVGQLYRSYPWKVSFHLCLVTKRFNSTLLSERLLEAIHKWNA